MDVDDNDKNPARTRAFIKYKKKERRAPHKLRAKERMRPQATPSPAPEAYSRNVRDTQSYYTPHPKCRKKHYEAAREKEPESVPSG